MKVEKFRILQLMRELVLMIEKQMDNFPKKDIELKNKMRTNSYEILELAYEANITDDKQYKKKTLQKVIAKVKIIDFLLNMSQEKQIINSKKYCSFGNKLDDIVKYVTGWIKSINE